MLSVNFYLDYTDLKWNYTAPATKLMLYLQEAAILHSEKSGLTMDYFLNTKSGWVICDWDIQLLAPVYWGDTLRVDTYPALFKGVMAHRGFNCYNEKGQQVLRAASKWVYTDRVRLRPIKVKEEMAAKYGQLMPLPIETEFKIPTLEAPQPVGESLITVTRRDTDTNRHANNVSYVLWATDLLTDREYNNGVITRLKIAYKKQCVMGDRVKVSLYRQGYSYLARITDPTGEVLLCEIYFELRSNYE